MLYLDKVVEKDAYVSFLKSTIEEIAAIIYYQSSLRDQDRWLNGVIQDGLYNPEEEERGEK